MDDDPVEVYDAYAQDYRLQRTHFDRWLTIILAAVVVALGLTLVSYVCHERHRSWHDAPLMSQIV